MRISHWALVVGGLAIAGCGGETNVPRETTRSE